MLKKVLRARPYRVLISTGIWVGAFCMMPSCSDDYEWAQEKPSWLGQSIYDEPWQFRYLFKDGGRLGAYRILKQDR